MKESEKIEICIKCNKITFDKMYEANGMKPIHITCLAKMMRS